MTDTPKGVGYGKDLYFLRIKFWIFTLNCSFRFISYVAVRYNRRFLYRLKYRECVKKFSDPDTA